MGGVSGGRIIVVDDEPGMREFLEIMLQKDGYSVVTAGDGRQAEEKINSQIFDLAIIDVQMPTMDGLDLLKKLNEKAPGKINGGCVAQWL